MFRSAVVKLTAAYVAIVMSICVVFSIVLYHVAVSELHTGIYNQYTRWLNEYQPFGLRQPGTPSIELALRSHHIFLQILYFNVLVLIVTSIACYLLARRTLKPIEAAHENQKRFTADVSHELRTPLTSMKMESEVTLLDKKARAGELRRTLSSNLEEISRMEAIINNLLLLSTMEAGKLRTEFVRLDIADIVTAAVESVSKLAETKHVELAVTTMHKHIEGDPASLTQLCVILLENAIKYSPDDSTVTVTIVRGRGRMVIDIEDKGEGIPATALPHVFDRFYRADNARTTTGAGGTTQGFGLGLSLAKLIADLHGGEIILTSAPGSGTQARVLLPINRVGRRG